MYRSHRSIIGLAAVALIASASFAAAEVRLCTGANEGIYSKVGSMIEKQFGEGLTVVTETGGTWGNVERTALKPKEDPEACDAYIGQPDGVSVLKQGYYDENGKLTGANPAAAAKLVKVGTLHREYLYVLTEKGGAESLSDLEGTEGKIAIGAPGSGGWLIWQNLVYEDSGYATLVEEPTGGFDGAALVAAGMASAVIMPAGKNYTPMTDADELFGDKLQLAEANDGDFDDATDADGKQLYDFVDFDGNSYPGLVSGYWNGKVETISWLAGVYINADRVSREDRSKLLRAVAKASKEAVASYGG